MATLGMPDSETKWAYSCFIDMLNDRDRPLTDDAGFICGFTGLSKRKWASVRAYLIGHGYLVEDGQGNLTNPRFEREHAEREADHQRSVADGRKGGKISAAKRAGQGDLALGDQPKSELSLEKEAQESLETGAKPEDKSEIIGTKAQKTANGTQPPPQARARAKRREARESESESSTSGCEPAPVLDPFELADHLTRIAGVRNVEPARIVANVQIVREWLGLGVDVGEIERTIIAARERSGQPLHSLKYFDPSIRKSHARKAHPHERSSHDQPEIADPLLRRYLERGGTLDQ